jgi:hypothetical protein
LATARLIREIDLEIGEFSVGASSSVAGKSIEGSHGCQDSEAIILAIKRSQEMPFHPSSTIALRAII